MALFEVNCFSNTLGMGVHFNVIIPQNNIWGEIGTKQSGRTKYPVLYLLHGLSDDETTWLRRTSIERYATEKGVAVVMPTTRRGWYCDTPMGNFASFIGNELPALIAEFFPTISQERKDTFIAGLSMGGYGALKFALTNPERYAACAGLSGAYHVMTKPGCERFVKEGLFKSAEDAEKQDIISLIPKLKDLKDKPKVFIWCGTGDGLIESSRHVRDLLSENGFDVAYSESEEYHGWKYWDEQIQNVLDWLPIE